MKFKSVLAAACAASAVLFVDSCKKDEAKTGSPGCLVLTATETGTLGDETETVTYNNAGQVATYTVAFSGGSVTILYSYNAAGQIVTEATSDASLSETLTYDGSGRLTKTESTLNSSLNSRDTYSYNSNGQLFELDNFGQENGTGPLVLITHSTFTYATSSTHDPATMNRYVDFTGSGLTEIHAYEYDSKPAPNPTSDASSPEHNVTKDTQSDSGGKIVNTTTYTYEYNSSGYPTKQTMASSGNDDGLLPQSSVTLVTYKCN